MHVSSHVMQQQCVNGKAIQEHLKLLFINHNQKQKFLAFLRAYERHSIPSTFVWLTLQAMITALTIPQYRESVVDMNSFWVATDIALVDNIRDNYCIVVLNRCYKTAFKSWKVLCSVLESNRKDLQNNIASLLACHSLEAFCIIGLYVRPYSASVSLTETMLLLLMYDGTILQYNMEEAHLYKVCDVDRLEDMKVGSIKTCTLDYISSGISDDRRYHYKKKTFIDESKCLVDTRTIHAPYRAIKRAQVI